MSATLKSNGTINITRGDTFYLKLRLTDMDGEPVKLHEGDAVRFALKEDYYSEVVLVEKEIPIDTMILQLTPGDTKNLDFGSYVYDIQVRFADGDVDTVIPRKIFNVLEEVE
jgi:hypothetical protein